jgi:hypothetical protein
MSNYWSVTEQLLVGYRPIIDQFMRNNAASASRNSYPIIGHTYDLVQAGTDLKSVKYRIKT